MEPEPSPDVPAGTDPAPEPAPAVLDGAPVVVADRHVYVESGELFQAALDAAKDGELDRPVVPLSPRTVYVETNNDSGTADSRHD